MSRRNKESKLVVSVLFVAVAACLISLVYLLDLVPSFNSKSNQATSNSSNAIGRFERIANSSEVVRKQEGRYDWRSVDAGYSVFDNDTVFVGPRGGAIIELKPNARLELKERTMIRLRRVGSSDAASERFDLELSEGNVELRQETELPTLPVRIQLSDKKSIEIRPTKKPVRLSRTNANVVVRSETKTVAAVIENNQKKSVELKGELEVPIAAAKPYVLRELAAVPRLSVQEAKPDLPSQAKLEAKPELNLFISAVKALTINLDEGVGALRFIWQIRDPTKKLNPKSFVLEIGRDREFSSNVFRIRERPRLEKDQIIYSIAPEFLILTPLFADTISLSEDPMWFVRMSHETDKSEIVTVTFQKKSRPLAAISLETRSPASNEKFIRVVVHQAMPYWVRLSFDSASKAGTIAGEGARCQDVLPLSYQALLKAMQTLSALPLRFQWKFSTLDLKNCAGIINSQGELKAEFLDKAKNPLSSLSANPLRL